MKVIKTYEQITESGNPGMNIEQIAFQEVVGEIEVLGELLIRKATEA